MKPTTRIPWRTQYDTQRDEEEGLEATINCQDESLTMQSFAEDADLNVIAKRFGLDKTGIPVGEFDPNSYGDFTDVPDLRTALDIIRDAKHKFMELPPKLRARFHNDPSELWDFVRDPENGDEAVRLGLLLRPETQQAPAQPAPKQTPKATQDLPKGVT